MVDVSGAIGGGVSNQVGGSELGFPQIAADDSIVGGGVLSSGVGTGVGGGVGAEVGLGVSSTTFSGVGIGVVGA